MTPNLYPTTTDDLLLEDIMPAYACPIRAADNDYQAGLERGEKARAIAKAAVNETWDNPVSIVKALQGFDLGKDEIAAIAKLRRLAVSKELSEAVRELTKHMDEWVEQHIFKTEEHFL